MNIINYSSKEALDEYIRKNMVKSLGFGREGSCFLMPEDIVIKKIFASIYYEEWLRKFEGVNVPGFYFASGGILIDDFVKALSYRYAPGEEIRNVSFGSYDIDTLRKALNDLKSNITTLSKLGIRINDIFPGNILFDGNSFSMIDTQGYEYENNKNLVEMNVKGVMRLIYEYLYEMNPILSKFITTNFGKEYLWNPNLLANPLSLLEMITEKFREEYKEDMKTLDDIGKLLK